ncbi:MAG: YggS family pyridoxal phosphate-dependent enzyme [Chloroflexota bacterium]
MIDRTSDLIASIRDRHTQVLEAIAAAARRAGRSPDAVRLVVVTKSQPYRVVEAAIDAGIHILGENYAEEAVRKIQALQEKPTAPPGVEWHMIGHVQGRKAKLVAPNFDLLHSLDSLRLAERLDRLAAEIGRELPVLLEFNVGGEAEKHGWTASEESAWPVLLDDVEAIAGCPNLKVRGLMTMPPLSSAPEDARIYFRRLRKLQDFLGARIPKAEWAELSMGTSADFAVAIEEGATLVRIGEAILGPRSAWEPP